MGGLKTNVKIKNSIIEINVAKIIVNSSIIHIDGYMLFTGRAKFTRTVAPQAPGKEKTGTVA